MKALYWNDCKPLDGPEIDGLLIEPCRLVIVGRLLATIHAMRERRCETCLSWTEIKWNNEGECEYLGLDLTKRDFCCNQWIRKPKP